MYIGLLGLPSQNTINQKFTSHSSGGWKLKIRCQYGLVLVRALFWGLDHQLLAVTSSGGKVPRSSVGSLL